MAQRAAILYFVIDSLAVVNTMYQYSLSFFKSTYNYSIESCNNDTSTLELTPDSNAPLPGSRSRPATAVLSARLEALLAAVTENTFHTVCRGLFEEHKPLFSILVCLAIERAAGTVPEAEWAFFLRGGRVPSASAAALRTVGSLAVAEPGPGFFLLASNSISGATNGVGSVSSKGCSRRRVIIVLVVVVIVMVVASEK